MGVFRFYPAELYDSWYSLQKSNLGRKGKMPFQEYMEHVYPLLLSYLEKRWTAK